MSNSAWMTKLFLRNRSASVIFPSRSVYLPAQANIALGWSLDRRSFCLAETIVQSGLGSALPDSKPIPRRAQLERFTETLQTLQWQAEHAARSHPGGRSCHASW